MTTVLDSASGVPTRFSSVRASAPTYAPLSHDLDVDVCVIGGGLAGLTVARELVRRGWSVAVLEAKRVAWNASGRNGGFVLPGFAEDLDAIVDRYACRVGYAVTQFGSLAAMHNARHGVKGKNLELSGSVHFVCPLRVLDISGVCFPL